jgi:uncharacterized protein
VVAAYNHRVTTDAPKIVHVVSHGPACLDGIAAAVVVARYYREATVLPHFSSNAKINETLLHLPRAADGSEQEVWITDISWTDPAVDRHLQDLVDAGTQVFWIDHHRTALERHRRGEVTVRFTDHVLSEAYAATRLTYEYLRTRLQRERRPNDWFDALQRLVSMTDDNDRWIHQLPGSRELGLVVSLLGPVAYGELLTIDPEVTYTPRMQEAQQQLQDELRHSFEVAERSRVVQRVPQHSLSLVTAVCYGYPSEVADAWGQTATDTIFALFDGRSLSVSLRRSPDCTVDLSVLAQRFGGGGHPAAAGCEMQELPRRMAEWLAERLADRIDR